MNGHKDKVFGFIAGGVVMMVLSGFITDIFEGFDSQRAISQELASLQVQVEYLRQQCGE